MKLELVEYSVVGTRQIDDEKFVTIVSIAYKLAEDKSNLFPIQIGQIEVEQNNSMTGFEMDKQVEQECDNFVEKLSNQ